MKTVILASIIQREAGQNVDDMAKIGRVFLNRLDQGMNLQSDATVAYGTGNTHTVWTTDAERADASNKWNTYANPGLPYGPIGNPGAEAIQDVEAFGFELGSSDGFRARHVSLPSGRVI